MRSRAGASAGVSSQPMASIRSAELPTTNATFTASPLMIRIRPSTTATSAANAGAPDPSTTVPPAISRSAESGIRGAVEAAAPHPSCPHHIRVRAEDEAAGDLLGLDRVDVGERGGERRIDGDQVRLFTNLHRADGVR